MDSSDDAPTIAELGPALPGAPARHAWLRVGPDTYRVGDAVELFAGVGREPLVAELAWVLSPARAPTGPEEARTVEGRPVRVGVRWFFRAGDVGGGLPAGALGPRELLWSPVVDDNNVDCLLQPTRVAFLPGPDALPPAGPFFCRFAVFDCEKWTLGPVWLRPSALAPEMGRQLEELQRRVFPGDYVHPPAPASPLFPSRDILSHIPSKRPRLSRAPSANSAAPVPEAAAQQSPPAASAASAVTSEHVAAATSERVASVLQQKTAPAAQPQHLLSAASGKDGAVCYTKDERPLVRVGCGALPPRWEPVFKLAHVERVIPGAFPLAYAINGGRTSDVAVVVSAGGQESLRALRLTDIDDGEPTKEESELLTQYT
eukprot:m51a1_g11510 hypothetical protein (373) ;mRNA; f:3664-5531